MNDDRFAETIRLVKDASDVVTVIGSYLTLRQAGATFKGLCPFHSDNRPSFDVDPKRQRYRCWSCGESGDVIKFVMKQEKVEFMEALEMLARRAGIAIEQMRKPADPVKLSLLDALKWAADLYTNYLLNDPGAETARAYLGERKLLGETVRKFGLGFAPLDGDWLTKQAHRAPAPIETLVEAGLLSPSSYGAGYYDRFRERVLFPIRNLRGEVVGFGGRVLPGSAYAERGPKYLNTADSPVFKKGELVYGLDHARLAAQASGCLAVVEGYTDVLMAHQHGVTNVVATLGTALTADHVRQLRRFAQRVVLVYDADAGGTTGVDRALEIFLREDVELSIATLPDGLDPFDLFVQQGAEPFKAAMANAVDVLEYKIDHVMNRGVESGVAGDRHAIDAVLALLALTPEAATTDSKLRRELILSRIARRFGLGEKTLSERLADLRKRRTDTARDPESADRPARITDEVAHARQSEGGAKADPVERELVEVLLSDPAFTPRAKAEVPIEEIEHPGLRRVISEMYDMVANGVLPDLDLLRVRLVDRPKLADFALRAQEVGLRNKEKLAWFERILTGFRERRTRRATSNIKGQLQSAADPAAALELLKRLQQATKPVPAQ
ncbi:MAG: DNA primase [Gemmataceae bacterium]|nr:DNA primase [Gemmataceae bacterium]